MKRIIISILFILCLVVALPLTATAESTNKLTYAVGASAPTASANQEFTILVEITENSGFIWGRADVSFDKSVLTYVGYTNDTSAFKTESEKAFTVNVTEDGVVRVSLGEMSALFGGAYHLFDATGHLVALTFRVNADAPTGVTTISVNSNTMNIRDVNRESTFTINSASTDIIITNIGEHECMPSQPVEENRVEPTCTEKGSYDSVVKCIFCQVELSRTPTEIPALGHTESAPVKENEKTAEKCDLPSTYDEVVYCSVCNAEISRTEKEIPPVGHTNGTPVIENEKPATKCEEFATYDEVVYCTVCNTEISRTQKTGEALAHKPGSSVIENEKPGATCNDAGSYDEVTYCLACGKELSRETKSIPAKGHKKGNAKLENDIASTCTQAGSYDLVYYCVNCGEELQRDTTPRPLEAHTEGDAVFENTIEPTCTNVGSYDKVVYCKLCSAQVSVTTVTLEKLPHTPGEAVRKNETPATCTTDGAYDHIVDCSVCGANITRERKLIKATGHSPAASVTENLKEATCYTSGGYDTVVYCKNCNEKLSSESTVLPKLEHIQAPAVIENRREPVNCGQPGSYESVVYCTLCKDKLSSVVQYIPAPDHTPGPAATATTPQICTVCNAILAPAHGHTHSWSTVWSKNEVEHWNACTGCDEKQNVEAHHYSNVCDADCNICGATRTIKGHEYDNDCDEYCNKCNAKRVVVGHVYDNDCDTTCNTCFATRSITHKYDNSCDAACNVCGLTRTPGEHNYGEWVVVTEPTATNTGISERYCSICNAKDFKILPAKGEETSAQVRQRVSKARLIQQERYKGQNVFANSHLNARQIEKYCVVTDDARKIIELAADKMKLSTRGYTRMLKVARTIADLAGSEVIDQQHVAEAVAYRGMDTKYWGRQ